MKKIDLKVDNVNLSFAIKMVCDAVLMNGDIRLTIDEYKGKRTISANAQAHVWAKAISEHTGEDVKTVYNRLKKDHGLPILLADPEHGPVADFILQSTNFYSRREDKQLKIIEAMEVTRKFSTKQHNQFRDSVQQYWNEQGLNIDYLERG